MTVQLIVATPGKTPDETVGEVELPSAPAIGETLLYKGTVYSVVKTHWNIDAFLGSEGETAEPLAICWLASLEGYIGYLLAKTGRKPILRKDGE